jgi:PIN domain nuclease of toxin-antitoxin system
MTGPPTPTRRARGAGGDLVLDTHVWIWAVEGTPDRLHRKAADAIEEATRSRALIVSAISVWEIAMLVKKGRLALATSITNWVAASLRPPGVRVIPVGTAIVLDSVGLPDLDYHKDPADRLIVATARKYGTLLTCDEMLLDWGRRHGHVRLIDGRP